MELLAPGVTLREKYRIERVIGVGGFGAVYEATHLPLDQRVAIKVLSPQWASRKEVVERFLREARATAKLRTPHVVRMMDVDVTSTGAPLLVMELLQGRGLDTVVTSGPPVAAVIDWTLQICAGVAEAHAAGIIHRDLKPANVLLVDQDRTVKIVDFGVSRVMSEAPLTRASDLIGSPECMAPEQIQGGDVDARVDQYAIGVMLYRLLAGRAPFPVHDDAEAAPYACMMATLEAVPVPLAEVRSDLPAALSEVVMRAMARDPGARFESVSALADALRRAVEARSLPPVRRAPYPKRRLLVALGIVAGAATLAFAAFAVQRDPPVLATLRHARVTLPERPAPPISASPAVSPSPARSSPSQDPRPVPRPMLPSSARPAPKEPLFLD